MDFIADNPVTFIHLVGLMDRRFKPSREGKKLAQSATVQNLYPDDCSPSL